MEEEDEERRLDRELIELLNELRVALPGVQVLFAFLLILPFSRGFPRVTETERVVYFVALVCTTVSTVLFITPTTYHRIRFRDHDKEHLIETANRLAIAGTVFLASAMSCAVYVIGSYVFDVWVGIAATAFTAVVFAWLWYALPLSRPGERKQLRPSGARALTRGREATVEPMSETVERAILAGGCFWGMQDLIRKRPGVLSTRVGYTGGDVPNATYRNHGTHAEAIEILFDPEQITYRDLLELFFQIHDPTTLNRQGNDVGTSYRSAIFYVDDEQRRVAEDTIADVEASGLWPGKVVTEVTPAGPFWEAEPEHQDYLQRYPYGYTCHFPRPNWVLPRRAESVRG